MSFQDSPTLLISFFLIFGKKNSESRNLLDMVTNEKRKKLKAWSCRKNRNMNGPRVPDPTMSVYPHFSFHVTIICECGHEICLAPLNLSVLLIITPLSNLKTSLDIHQIKDNSDLDVEKRC